MYFGEQLKSAYSSSVESINAECCEETTVNLAQEICRAARLVLMIETLNCFSGLRDTRDDDLLPALKQRRDQLLFDIAEFDVRARMAELEPGLYLALPSMGYCHKQLLPLYVINKSGKTIYFAERKVLAIVSDESGIILNRSGQRTAAQTTGENLVEIPEGEIVVVDDYDIYIDGDCLDYWSGTFLINNEACTFSAHMRRAMSKKIVALKAK